MAVAKKNEVTRQPTTPSISSMPVNALLKMGRGLFPNTYGAPMGEGAIWNASSKRAQSMMDPLLARLLKTYTARGEQGSRAIADLTRQYADRLGTIAPAVRSEYQASENRLSGAGAALADYIRNEGAQMSNSLGETAAQAGTSGVAPQAEAAAGNLGVGISGAQAAANFAGMSTLIGQGADRVAAAQMLPGFARMEGIQQMGAFQGQLQRDYEDQVMGLLSQIPGLTTNLYGTLSSRDMANRQGLAERDAAIASFLSQGLDRNQRADISEAELGMRAQELQFQNDWFNADPDNFEGSGSSAGLTAKDLAEMKTAGFQGAVQLAGQLASGHLDQNGNPIQGAKPAQYNEVQRQVYEYLKGQLGGLVPDAVIRQMARQATNAAGLFPQGNNGKGNTQTATKRGDPGGAGNAGQPSSNLYQPDSDNFPLSVVSIPFPNLLDSLLP